MAKIMTREERETIRKNLETKLDAFKSMALFAFDMGSKIDFVDNENFMSCSFKTAQMVLHSASFSSKEGITVPGRTQ